MRMIFLFSALFVLTSCSTQRVVNFKYDEVSKILKNRFVTNYDEFKQSKPKVTERPGELSLYFESPVDFFYGVEVTLGARKLDCRNTSVSAWIIEDHRTFWGYTGRNRDMEKDLLDVIQRRLRTGEWQRMPWRAKKEVKTKKRM